MKNSIDINHYLYAIPNLASRVVSTVAPWQCDKHGEQYKAFEGNKEKYREWCSTPNTEGCFFTAFRGVNPNVRISDALKNPPVASVGLVADYDLPISDEEFEKRCEALKLSDKAPNYVSRTFSGGVRAVWLYEKELPYDRVINEKLMAKLLSLYNVKGAFKGFDEAAYSRPSQMFELGRDWRMLNQEYVLSDDDLRNVLEKIAESAKWYSSALSISLTAVWEAMQTRGWDKLWGDNDFVIGNRGKRFWTEVPGDNPTACILCEKGIKCFSGTTKIFWTWDDIFGKGWASKQQTSAVNEATKDMYYDTQDGKVYIYSEKNVGWTCYKVTDAQSLLECAYGIVGQTETGLDLATHTVKNLMNDESRKTCGVGYKLYDKAPLIHNPRFPYPQRNLSRLHVLLTKPCSRQVTQWGDGFPKIAEFLGSLLAMYDADGKPDTIQLDCFLAWLKCFYTQALAGELQVGQAMILAGPHSCGKTFTARCLLDLLMGGSTDVARLFMEKDQFNAAMSGVPVWYLGDIKDSGTARDRETLKSSIKKYVADATHNFRAMRQEGFDQEWAGRQVITLNDSMASLDMLPDFDENSMDKVILLKCAQSTFKFNSTSRSATEADVLAELPQFASFLLNWQPPETVAEYPTDGTVNETRRFGVKPFHHPELIRAANMRSVVSSNLELLDEWRNDYFATNTSLDFIEARPAKFAALLQADMTYGTLARTTIAKSPTSMGTFLAKVAKDPSVEWVVTKSNKYVIYRSK